MTDDPAVIAKRLTETERRNVLCLTTAWQPARPSAITLPRLTPPLAERRTHGRYVEHRLTLEGSAVQAHLKDHP